MKAATTVGVVERSLAASSVPMLDRGSTIAIARGGRMYKLMNVSAVVHEPGASARPISVHVLDLSEVSGRFVTRGYVHPEATIEIQLPTLAIGESIPAIGSVRSCTHLRGMEHTIVIVFNEAIDVAAVTAVIAEKGDRGGSKLASRELSVLLLDARAVDREVLGQRLATFQLRVLSVDHAGAAIDLLKTRSFDVLVIDEELEDESGLDAITRIREGIFTGPTVMLTTSTSMARHREMIERGACGVVIKPATPLLIAQVLREAAGGGVGAERGVPQVLEETLFDRTLTASLIEEIGRVSEMLRASHGGADMTRACRTIAGAAPCVGLTLLGRAADRAAVALECGVSIDNHYVSGLGEVIEATTSAIRRASQAKDRAAA